MPLDQLMKTTIQFDLPEDECEQKMFMLRHEMLGAIVDARRQVRSLLKHGEISESERLHLEEIRSTLYEGLDLLDG